MRVDPVSMIWRPLELRWSPDGSTDGLALSKKKSYTLSFWEP